MRITFCRSNDLGGWLIRLLTFSNWNHVAIEANGYVYESAWNKGVTCVPAYSYGVWDKMKTVNVDVPNEDAAIEFLKDQVGKQYDWMALWALPFREAWHHPNKWFCSELAATALATGGIPFRNQGYRITPKDLWLALPC